MISKKTHDFLVSPLSGTIKTIIADSNNAKRIIDVLFPPLNGLYSKTNLVEYLAERNSRKIAEMLGDNYNVSNIKTDLSHFNKAPQDWDFAKELRKVLVKSGSETLKDNSVFDYYSTKILRKTDDIIDCCEKEIDYINRDIWDGDIKSLMLKSFTSPEKDYTMFLLKQLNLPKELLNKVEKTLEKYVDFIKNTNGTTFEDFDFGNWFFKNYFLIYE